MDTLEILKLIEKYNSAIKYYLKLYTDKQLSPENLINLNNSDHPLFDITSFQTKLLSNLESGNYSDSFITEINQLYQLSQSNSDLVALNSSVLKQLYKDYPITKELEQLSFNIFEFIYNEIFEARDEYERLIIYKGFEVIQTNIPEYWFKDNTYILWNTYYLLNNIVNAQIKQKQIDFDNQKDFVPKENIGEYLQKYKSTLIEQITSLSQDFCNRNFIFSYLRNNKQIEKEYLTGYILSDVLASLNSSEYAKYIELDYMKYPTNYDWQFEKKSLKDYPDLSSLPYFERLINLLTNTLFVKELNMASKKENETIEESNEEKNAGLEKTELSINPETEEKMITDIVFKEELLLLQEEVTPIEENTILENKSVKNIPTEYILPVPILDLIYKEFNDELWNDIGLVEFLDIFTTAINKQENFKLKSKQTVRFYFLLKKIWINSDNKALFNTEKEWIIPFLQNYRLSYSAYTNQFIKNEGGLKHRKFTKAVDKILPKDEID